MQLKILLISLLLSGFVMASPLQVTPLLNENTNSTLDDGDFNKMLANLEKLAQYDAIAANYTLGSLYLVGSKEKGIEKDYAKAHEYFLKDSKNLTLATYKIAEMHYHKLLKAPNDTSCKCVDTAIDWFKKALTNKNTVDYNQLAPFVNAAIGSIYLNDLSDAVNAFPYLLETVSISNDFPKVEFIVAYLYNDEKLPFYDEEKANFYLNKSWNNPKNTDEFRKIILNYVEGKQQ